MITKLLRNALGSLLAGVLLAGCGSAPRPVVSDLAFPVLVIYPDAGVRAPSASAWDS